MDEDMTQMKLEILGPYTPEHPGPFCTRDGRAARIICADRKSSENYDWTIVLLVDDGCEELVVSLKKDGKHCSGVTKYDLMNAREVPVAREFWVNKYKFRELSGAYPTKGMADSFSGRDRVECIHVREVQPGEE